MSKFKLKIRTAENEWDYIERLSYYIDWCDTNVGERTVGWDILDADGKPFSNIDYSVFHMDTLLIKDEQQALIFKLVCYV